MQIPTDYWGQIGVREIPTKVIRDGGCPDQLKVYKMYKTHASLFQRNAVHRIGGGKMPRKQFSRMLDNYKTICAKSKTELR